MWINTVYCVFVKVNPSKGGKRVCFIAICGFLISSMYHKQKCQRSRFFVSCCIPIIKNFIRSHEWYKITLDTFSDTLFWCVGCTGSNKTAIVNVRIVCSMSTPDPSHCLCMGNKSIDFTNIGSVLSLKLTVFGFRRVRIVRWWRQKAISVARVAPSRSSSIFYL